MNYLDEFIHIFKNDLLLLKRNQELLWFTLLFGGVIFVLFMFTTSNEQPSTSQVVSFLWVALLFTGVLSIDRFFEKERSQGTLELIAILPLRKSVFYLAKCLFSLIYICLPLGVFCAVAFFAWEIPIIQAIPSLLLGALGLSALSALFGPFPLSKQSPKILLPLLVFPLAIPLVFAGTWATFYALEKNASSFFWHNLLWIIDALYILMGIFLFRPLCATR